jgi:ABC-type branched-subunit amino acid transport system permease subunit
MKMPYEIFEKISPANRMRVGCFIGGVVTPVASAALGAAFSIVAGVITGQPKERYFTELFLISLLFISGTFFHNSGSARGANEVSQLHGSTDRNFETSAKSYFAGLVVSIGLLSYGDRLLSTERPDPHSPQQIVSHLIR